MEVASFLQIPSFQIIGLPSPEIAEARERVRAAIDASELEFPRRRVIVNLSPASIRKRGTGVDLAVALAIVQDSEAHEVPPEARTVVAWGELGLDGSVKPAGGITRAVYAAWEAGADRLIVSEQELGLALSRKRWIQESALLPGSPPEILGASTLREAWEGLRSPGWGHTPLEIAGPESQAGSREEVRPELVRSEQGFLLPLAPSLERVISVSACGSHHLFLVGPRGTGKSHALEWLIALQPPLSAELRVRHALLEELKGSSTCLPDGLQVPIRRVSAQARPAALLGGVVGALVRPGEFSLAHGGLLVADELPEWQRDSREALREPMERGLVSLTRTQRSVELPARFTLAANGNFCPCGGMPPEMPTPPEAQGRRIPRCHCTDGARRNYLARMSGPVLDRIDLVTLVAGTGTPFTKPRSKKQAKAMDRLPELQEQVRLSRDRATRAWGKPAGLLRGDELEQLLDEHPGWREWNDPNRYPSLRTRHKVLRVALSLAAWDGSEEPSSAHFVEAALYRPERFGLGR